MTHRPFVFNSNRKKKYFKCKMKARLNKSYLFVKKANMIKNDETSK